MRAPAADVALAAELTAIVVEGGDAGEGNSFDDALPECPTPDGLLSLLFSKLAWRLPKRFFECPGEIEFVWESALPGNFFHQFIARE